MKIKKCNAAAGLAVVLSLLAHAIVMTYSLWTGWYNYRICKMLPHITVVFLAIHAFLSIVLLFFFHDGADMSYRKLNRATVIQRASAVAMIVLLHFHMNAYAHVATGETLSAGMTAFRIATELAFFAAVTSHIAVSLSKACITLGILPSETAAVKIDRAAYLICGALMLAAGSGMVSFYLKGIL